MSSDIAIRVLMVVSLSLLAVVSTVINGGCIFIIIRKSKQLMKKSNYLLLNLLIVQFIQSLVVLPLYAGKKAETTTYPWLILFCDGFRFTYMLTFYASAIGVLLIGIERLLATTCVLWYKYHITKEKILFVIIASWIYIVSICIIPFFQHDENSHSAPHVLNKQNNESEKTIVNHHRCKYEPSKVWTIFMLTVNCFIPYIIIVICHSTVVHKVHSLGKRTRSRTASIINTYALNGEHEQTRMMSDNCFVKNTSSSSIKTFSYLTQESKESDSNSVILHSISEDNDYKIITKTIQQHHELTNVAILLSVAYLFFWSPSIVYYILWHLCPNSCFSNSYKNSDIEKYVGFTMKYLAFLDSVAAPMIYCFYNKQFRSLVPIRSLRKKPVQTRRAPPYNTEHFGKEEVTLLKIKKSDDCMIQQINSNID